MFLLINKMYDVPNVVLEFEASLVSEMKLVNNITDWVEDTEATRHICFSKELYFGSLLNKPVMLDQLWSLSLLL